MTRITNELVRVISIDRLLDYVDNWGPHRAIASRLADEVRKLRVDNQALMDTNDLQENTIEKLLLGRIDSLAEPSGTMARTMALRSSVPCPRCNGQGRIRDIKW